jgi:type III pantothenate kinase
MTRTLLIDISNSFTKVAIARDDKIGRVNRIPTPSLSASQLLKIPSAANCDKVILSSVVPSKNKDVLRAFPRALPIGPNLDLGVGIDYPKPQAIGADRLANAAGCAAHHGCPAIVVDFGTAVTFDVLSAKGAYIGGVIAPGLNAMTHYLHDRTALLPLIKLREPNFAIGRSTQDAMLSGAVHGYRGLIRGIIEKICEEEFPKKCPLLIATGGDASLIAKGAKLFDVVDPLLTLRGLLVIAQRNELPD